MNNTSRFDGRGEVYAKARPRYAAELFDYLKNSLGIPEGSVFADVGSGTGIFTEQLLRCGYRVWAVEPNADMRRRAEEALSGYEGFVSVEGTDSCTGLLDACADCVSAAQAFHWFDPEAFRTECRRILKPGGRVILVYNNRDKDSGPMRALAAVRRRFNPRFHGFSEGIRDEDCRAFFGGACEVFRAGNSQTYDRDGFLARELSSSYSLRPDDRRYGEYLTEIRQIFDAFAAGGVLTVPTETAAFIGTV